MTIHIDDVHRHGIDLAKYADDRLVICSTGKVTNGRGEYAIWGATSSWTVANFGTIGSGGIGLGYGGEIDNFGRISGVGMRTGTVVNHGSIHYITMGQASVFNGLSGTIASNGGFYHDYPTIWIEQAGTVDNLGKIVGSVDVARGLIINGSTHDTSASILKGGSDRPIAIVDTGTIINYGTIYRASAVHGTIINHGTIQTPVQVSGDLTLVDDGVLPQVTFVSHGVALGAASAATLRIADPSDFHAMIAGFSLGDTIDLMHTSVTNIANVGSALDALTASGAGISLHFAGAYTSQNLVLSSDHHGGTNITLV